MPMNKPTEGLKNTLARAYLLTILGRGSDILFYVGIFSIFSVEEVGLYSWAIAVTAFFGIALDLGLVQTLIREFSKGSLHLRSAVIASLAVRAPIFVAGAILLIAWNLIGHLSPNEFRSLAFAGTTQAVIVIENVCYAWLKANSKQTIANVFTIFDPLGRLLLLAMLVLLLGKPVVPDLLAVILVLHLSIVVSVLLVLRGVYRVRAAAIAIERTSLADTTKQLWSSGIVFGLIGFVTVMQNRFDWILVSTFSSRIDLANYSLANKVYEILQMFIGVAMLTVYPWICRIGAPRVFQTKVNIIVISLFISGVILSLAAGLYLPLVLHWIWGNKYLAAEPLLQILVPLVSLATAIMVLYYPLIAHHQERNVFKATFIATLAQLAVNLLFIPKMGSHGAVIGMGVLTVTNFLFYSVLTYQAKLSTKNQLWRKVIYLLLMFSLAAVLWITKTTMSLGVLILITTGITFGYFVLVIRREKMWLTAWIKRRFLVFNAAQ